MSCSKEEIERKRLAAIQKRQLKLSSPSSPLGNVSISNTTQNSPSFTSQNITGRKLYHPYKKPEINETENIPVTKVISGTIYLISEGRFEVNPSEFCVPLINIFKSLPSKCYGK